MIRFKIDKSSTERLEDINELYRFSNKTVACRIAMAISLKEDKYLDVSTPTSSDGREYTPTSNLFGSIISSVDNGLIFKAILSKHYHKNLSNQEFSSLFKQHLMHGLEVWSNALESLDIANGDHIKYISDKISIGVSLSRKVLMSQATTSASKLDQFTEELVFELGEDLRGERVKVPINNLNYFDNRNIAIAGMAGSGKTQLVKDILYQIKENTGGKLKYIFFDYKGEGNPDQLRPFLEATDTHFIDILDDGGLEFNPLSSISADQRQQMFSIKAFADTVGTFIPNIGVAQKQILVTVLQDLFAQNKTNRPNINELFQRLSEYYTENRKQPDTLFSGIQDLTLNLFKSDSDSENIFKKSVYLNLPPSLSDTLRQLVVFLLLRYFNTYFSSTNDCIPEGDIFPLRYVIVIDEAHIYLKNKNARKALEELLRLLRSKGVIIVMLSQGATDFKTADFDFASQVKLPICLNIQDKNYHSIQSFLGTPTTKLALEKSIEKLESGKAIVNFSGTQTINIRQWWKTQENHQS